MVKSCFGLGSDVAEPLSKLIDNLHNGERDYSCGCAVPVAMQHEFTFPIAEQCPNLPMQLWIGSASHEPVTLLHRDTHPVLLAQVIGRKRVILYPPHQALALYPRRAHNTFYQACWVDPVNPDLDRFPRFAEAQPIDVVIKPGEILYIPIGWFHYVFALDNVLSVSTIISSGQLLEEMI